MCSNLLVNMSVFHIVLLDSKPNKLVLSNFRARLWIYIPSMKNFIGRRCCTKQQNPANRHEIELEDALIR